MTRRAARLVAAMLACVCATAGGAPRPQTGAPARSPGKPTAPITIEFALAAEPAVGAAVEVSIEVRASAEVRDLALDVRAADPAALLVAAQAPVAGKPGTWIVTVVPLADATSYLSVTAQGTIGDAPQTRSVAIPLRVPGAKPTAQAARARAAAGEGEGVVLLPAVETVRPASK